MFFHRLQSILESREGSRSGAICFAGVFATRFRHKPGSIEKVRESNFLEFRGARRSFI